MSLTQTIIIFCAQYLIYLLIILGGLYFLFGLPRSTWPSAVIFGIITLPITFVLGLIAAKLFYDPRPFMISHVAPLIAHEPSNGFPSHHTILAAALTAITFRYNRRIGAAFLIITLLIGFSRVLAGVHHIIDIVASIAIATFVALLVDRIMKYIDKNKPKESHGSL